MPYPGKEYATLFELHRGALVELLDRIPARHGDASAWDGGMTVTQLVDHLYSTSAGVVDMLSGGTWQRQEPSMALGDAVARLHGSTARVVDKLSGMTDEDLRAEVTVFGGARWPAYRLVDFHREHEAHHKGQLWVMARLIGIDPPFFVRMGP